MRTHNKTRQGKVK